MASVLWFSNCVCVCVCVRVCECAYACACVFSRQIWWVIRTKYDWVIQRKFPFYIAGPPCDWDVLNNRSHIFAANTTSYNFNQNPYDQSQFIGSHLDYTGTPGYPAKGMGGTLVLPSAANPAVDSSGELPGINLPVYEPASRPTVAQFEAQYPDIPLDEHGLPVISNS